MIFSCIMSFSFFINSVSAVYNNETNIKEIDIENTIEYAEQAATTEINNTYSVDSDNIFYGHISVINDDISANNVSIQVYSSELIYSEHTQSQVKRQQQQ